MVGLGLPTPQSQLSLLAPLEKKAIVPLHKQSPLQMNERRDKRLCYNSDEKWALGHKCKSARYLYWNATSPVKRGSPSPSLLQNVLKENVGRVKEAPL